MSEEHPKYETNQSARINPRALLLFADPEYEPPTFADVQALKSISGKSASELGRIVGVDGRAFRRWTAPPKANNSSRMPYSAWRLLLIEEGLENGGHRLRAAESSASSGDNA